MQSFRRRRLRKPRRACGATLPVQLLPSLVTSIKVPYNSVWSYKDDGGAWYAAGFYQNAYDYSGWATGSAILGNGTLDSLPAGESVRTTIANPTNASRSYPLKRTFTIARHDYVTSMTLRVVCDDGCVVWINGIEVASVAKPTTLADNVDATSIAGNEGVPQVFTLTGSQLAPLVDGVNYIAMLCLDSGAASTDSAFGCQIEVTEWVNKAYIAPHFFSLHSYQLTTSVLDAAGDKSGCRLDPVDDLLYVIRNTNSIRRMTRTGELHGSEVALGNGIDDAEAICRIDGHPSGREWACVSEGDFSPGQVKIHLFDLGPNDSAISNVLTYDFSGLITCAVGYGAEGIEYIAATDKFYIVTQEIASGGLWECTLSPTPAATQLFSWMGSLVAGGAAASTGFVSDLHDMTALGRDSWCVIVNDAPLASGTTRLVEFSRTGEVHGTFTLPTGQTEGFAFDLAYPHDLFVVGEQTSGANFWRYSPEEKLLKDTAAGSDILSLLISLGISDTAGGVDYIPPNSEAFLIPLRRSTVRRFGRRGQRRVVRSWVFRATEGSITVTDAGGGATEAVSVVVDPFSVSDSGSAVETVPPLGIVGSTIVSRAYRRRLTGRKTVIRRIYSQLPIPEFGAVRLAESGFVSETVSCSGKGLQEPQIHDRRRRYMTALRRGLR